MTSVEQRARELLAAEYEKAGHAYSALSIRSERGLNWIDLASLRAIEAALRTRQSGDLQAEVDRLNAIINSPQSDDFLRAVSTESEHQRQRWGSDHDGGKTPADWFWLVGYLAGKALHSHAAGDTAKAEHHIITTAAACANWHRAMFGQTDMRPGIDPAIAAQQEVNHE